VPLKRTDNVPQRIVRFRLAAAVPSVRLDRFHTTLGLHRLGQRRRSRHRLASRVVRRIAATARSRFAPDGRMPGDRIAPNPAEPRRASRPEPRSGLGMAKGTGGCLPAGTTAVGARGYQQLQKRNLTMNRMLLTALIIGSIGVAGTAQAAGDAAAGKAKAGSCAMCHGPNGAGTAMAAKLAGMDPAKFIQAMGDYKSGTRNNAMMKNAATQLSADDTANLAAYYASLK
jgi:cytochrome c553